VQELIGAVGELSPKERKALAILLKQKGINLFGIAPVFRRKPEEALLLSYAQERQWFLWQLDPASAAYHLSSALQLRGELDIAALERSFNALMARHEALRTTFVQNAEQTLQVIAAEQPLVMGRAQLAEGLDEVQRNAAIKAFVEDETRQLFDLQQGPLLRVKLLWVADEHHVLTITQHHIISDGWSMQLMVDELMQLYAAASEGRSASLPPLPVQYPDYALWQRQWMDAGERERQLAYWVEQLAGEQPLLELPLDRPRPAEQSFRGAQLPIELPPALGAGLKRLAQQQNVTLFMLLLASFQTLLHRYSGQADIRVGVPIANRNRVETEGLIGFFVNTQILKARFDDQACFNTLLQQVKQTVLMAQGHQDLPFEQLVDALQPERSLSHNALFLVMYNHQSEDRRGAVGIQLPKLRLEGLHWDNPTAQFDLTLDTFDTEQGVSAALTYATDLFDPSTAQRMAQHWQHLLHAIVVDASQRIGDLALLDSGEQQASIDAWNPARVEFPATQSIHHLIEQQVERTPEAVAVVFDQQSLSYRQLNQRANRLAHQLIEHGVGPDVLVGLAVERSLEMLIGLLAILKAGGAYVPLDPAYPQERLAYMIEDSGIRLLLTQPSLLKTLPIPDGVRTLLLDTPELAGYSLANPQVAIDPANLAYVIYTSGSTGKPKGTLLPHHNVLRLFQATDRWFSFGPQDVWSLFHSYAFDFSVWEIFGALLYGGKLVVVPHDVSRSPEEFYALLCREGVTVLNQTPSAFKQLMPVACANESGNALRYVVFGGEALEVKALQPWFQRFGDQQPQLINMYGITETTVHVTYRPITLADLQADASSPIGQVIPDLTWYLLDSSLNPVAKGCIGELYVGQAGLARGYLNRGDLTATRFIADPFSTSGERLYRTGDLARYRADGVIEYIGRIDHQVKIRGFRIELGEIEARLLQLPAVREAVVLAMDGANGQQLVGYLVAEPGQLADAELREAIKAQLRTELPDYMVPAHLLFLETLPLTGNGKLDRKALPQPDASLLQQAYVAPQSELEQQIATIWQDVLKLEQVGLTDNFFELGGDSIISIQVVSRARQAGIRFTPKELFQHQTVQGLASVAQTGDADEVIDQAPVTGSMALLPIHQVFFEESIPERHHWNQSVLLKPAMALDAPLLDAALQALIAHHDALRLTFTEQGQAWVARFAPPSSPSVLWHSELADIAELAQLGEEAQRSLDLQQGPLLRAVLVKLPDAGQRLLLAIHHLAVDGVSWRILFEDLQLAYNQLAAGQAVRLPLKSSSVKAWAEQLQAYARSPALQDELPYWQAQLQGVAADLPCANPAGGLHSHLGLSVRTRLDQEHTRQLLQEAPAAYRTQVNDLLLTALARVIARWTESPSVLLQMEGHGREELFDGIDLTRTVGWFTSLYPVKLTPALSLGDSIKGIKEQLRAIPHKGIGFGALRYLGDPQAQQLLADLPVPRITFNYLGQFDASFDDDDALFVPVGENAGSEQSAEAPLGNWLSINGQVYNGELDLSWTFSHEMFSQAQVQELADAYALELEQLIAHCTRYGSGGVTPSDFPLARLDQAQLDRLPLAPATIKDIYPLAPMQQGMLFHTLYEQGSGDYIIQMSLEVSGLDPERFRQAWQGAVDAHDILRTGFVYQGEFAQPMQVVLKQVEVPFSQQDWRGRADLAAALEALAQAERRQGFELSQAPLLRLHLVRIGDERHQLIYTSHHILMDGWSNSQLLGEVLQRYSGQAVVAQGSRYHDYIAWLQGQDQALSEGFWKEQLRDLEEPTRLALAMAPLSRETGYGDCHVQLDAARTLRLNEFARAQKVTANTLLQAAWLLLLQRYTGQATVAFGATVAGRPAELKGVEQQIGLFINTLPVVATPQPEQTLARWLQKVQVQNLGLREHEHTPLFEIQRWAARSGEALFDTILVFENYPVSEALEQGAPAGLRFGAIDSHEQTNYPLTLAVGLGEALGLHFSFDRGHFSSAMIEQLAAHLMHLLQQMPELAERPLSEWCLLDQREHSQTLVEWNPRPARLVSEQPLHALIEAQVERAPQAIALTLGAQQMTYRQLNSRANQLAHRLIELGVGPDVLVGLAVERSLDMLVGLLAILKAGGAYVPLDPAYPEDRLAYMIEDSGLQLLLTQTHLLPRLPLAAQLPTLLLDEQGLAGYRESNPGIRVDPANLAYVIYTSGSTGKPKGALLSHHNVLRLFQATDGWFGFGPQDVWSLFHSYAFDFSVWEIFGALVYGGRLVLVPQDVSRSPEEFFSLLREQGVTVLNQTPSAFKQLLQVACSPEQAQARLALRYVVFGGEALDVQSLRPWFERFGDQAPQLINMYGITETTVHVTYRPISLADLLQDAASPIGEPIVDLSWYLLDADLNPVPKGCVGELYVGQAGLARGYLKRPDLSATRFIPDPFSASGDRLYRTGDLARYRTDGVVEYVGRIDHQVKIRGFRIELGEIEARLQQQDEVREALVLAVDGPSGQQLVGYLIARRDVSEVDAAAALRDVIKGRLKDVLPDYMVPAHLLFLERWPLTANGKLDRRALPAPDASLLQQHYLAPQSELEQQVAAVWQEVLELERIGLNDNFFELGGHSLLATQVVARLKQVLVCEVGLRDLFGTPTLGAFAAALALRVGIARARLPELVATAGKEQACLSLAQRRLWVVEQFASASGAYGMPLALRFDGELSVPLLVASLRQLVQRHEVLRTAYVADEEGDPQALISAEVAVDLPLLDLSALDPVEREARVAEAVEQNARTPISLLKAPLLRGQVLRLGPTEHVVLFAMHHIISDGWSMSILSNEMVEVYARLKAGIEQPLPALALQYSDYAQWQQQLEQAGVFRDQAAYWKDALAGHGGLLQLPTDHPRPEVASFEGRDCSFSMAPELHQALSALAREAGVTLYSTLLASFQVLLHRLSGSDDVLVGADVAGRPQAELESLIGFFVNILPLRSRFDADQSFTAFLAQAQETSLSAFEHQDLPFDMLVEAAAVNRRKGVNPLVQVLFVMNNLPIRSAGIEDIRVQALPSAGAYSKFDMALFIDDEAGQLHGTWQFACDLFKQERIELCVNSWMTILEQIVRDPDIRLGDINMPTNTVALAATTAAPAAPSKADKLGKFLKKAQSPATRPTAPVFRETLMVPGQVFPLLWEPTDPGLDLVQWIRNNRALVEEKLARHAGILFRGFAMSDIHAFEAFAEAVQPGLYGQYGDLPKKEGGKNTYRSTPYPEKKMILFHNESSHQDRWPRKQLFFCEQPSPVGGATPVVDCRLMYQKLPLALREKFESKGLLYVRTFADKLDVSWQHFFKTEVRDEVEARCRAAGIQWTWLDNDELQIRTPCPAIISHPVTGEKSFFNQVQLHHIYCLDPDVREDLLGLFGEQRMPRHVYYGDGSPIEDEVMQRVGDLYEECAVRFDWRKGDVILLDNMLAAHARDPFEGPRKIVVAMGEMIERSALEALSEQAPVADRQTQEAQA